MRLCMIPALLVALSVLTPLPALAIYRCSANGVVSYSDMPCDDSAQGATFSPAARADDAQAQQAQRKLARQQDELRRLQTERERKAVAEESARARAEAGRQAHAKRCKLLELKTRWSAEDATQAGIKQEVRAKRGARRKAEQYEVECGTSR